MHQTVLINPTNSNPVISNSPLYGTLNHFPRVSPSVIYYRLFWAPSILNDISFSLKLRNSGVTELLSCLYLENIKMLFERLLSLYRWREVLTSSAPGHMATMQKLVIRMPEVATVRRIEILQLSAQWPGLWMIERLEVTLFWYRPHCLLCVKNVLMLTSGICMTKPERSISKQDHLQPRCYSKAKSPSKQL